MFNWLTGFLMNPALALGGLAVASPILIHLLSRRRYRRIQWAAMSFLLEARKQNRRRIRLQQWILLALRCLAVLLIAAAVARPFVSTASLGGLLAGRGKTEHLLLLDDSYSMGYRASDGKTVFQAACHAVRQRVRRLAADAPFDMVSLYLTSRPQQPLAALASISPVEVRRLEDLLDTLSPSQRTARFDEACAALAETIRRSASQANVHLCVVSDFQRSDWMPRDRGAVSPAGAPLIALQEQRPDLRLTLIDVAAASPANLAITDVTMPHARVAVDVPTRVEVEVANHSTVAVDTLVLSVESGDRVLPPVILSRLGAGQTLREPIEVTLPVVGPGFLRVRLAGEAASRDGLSLDNARAVAVDVLPAVRVLLVNGAPDSDPFRDEAHLLRTALNPAGRVASGFEVVTMSASEVDAAEWDAFSAVLLANVGRISLDARQNLERFVASGGGLIVFCGDMIDIDHYNREWYRDGNGPLPAAFQEVHSAPVGSEPFEFGAWDEAHPLMRHFTGALAALLRQVRVTSFIAVREGVADKSDATATQPAGPTVVARYNDPAGSAAILESQFGRGRVVLVTTSADQDWNAWASSLSYVPMMLELVSSVAHPGDLIGPFTVGDLIRCQLDARRARAQARLRPPDYPVEPEIVLPEARSESGRLTFTHDAALRAGIWSLETTSPQGAPMRAFLPVNPDASESDLSPAGRVALEALFAAGRMNYVRGEDAFETEYATARRELWWPILLLAAIALMTEQGLAWYFGTKG